MTLDTRQSDLASLQVDRLMSELRQMIDQTRESIATTVNAKLTMLYWQIGNRIYKEILNEDRAAYGKAIVVSVSQQLTTEYGKSFNEKNLRRMIQFAEIFSDPEIVVSLIRHLSWTHFIALIPIKDAIKRDFYAEMCRLERWNVKTLRKKIDSMLFERTALSKKPDSLIRAEVNSLREEDRLSPDLVFRDPYFLDFLKLNDRYFERDIEDAIMSPYSRKKSEEIDKEIQVNKENITWINAYVECLKKEAVSFDQPIWKGDDLESDILEDFCLIIRFLDIFSREEKEMLLYGGSNFAQLKAALANNGYSSKTIISTKLIEIYSQQIKQLEQEIKKLEQERLVNIEADRLNCLLGTIPQEDNSDKILKYERSIQKSIFQNLFLLKKLQESC